MSWLTLMVGFAAAILGAMGLGGGAVLLVYLTVFLEAEQAAAQLTNLLFFLPVAAVALFFHIRAGLVDWHITRRMLLGGLPGALVGLWAASMLDIYWLQKGFAVLLLVMGIREISSKPKEKPPK